MIPLNILVILLEVILWVYLFLRFSKELGYWRGMLFADFVITTVDFVLLMTPLRTTIFSIYVIQRQSGRVIMAIPFTLGMILMVKSGIFYLGQELFPEWMRGIREVMGGEQGEEEE